MLKSFTFFLIQLVVLTAGLPLKGQNAKKNDSKVEFIVLKKKIDNRSLSSKVAMKLVDDYISLAKELNNNDELYNGYSLGMLYAEGKQKVLYSDSTVMIAMKSQDKRYIGLSYAGLANINFKLYDYKKSLDAALIADQYLQNETSKEFIYEPRFTIAKLKYVVGDYYESTRIIKEIYEYYKWKITQKGDLGIKKTYLASLIILMNNNSVMERFEENDKLIREGELFLGQHQLLSKATFTSAKALNDFTKKKYKDALNGFNSAVSHYKDTDFHPYEAFYAGMCHWKLNNLDKAELHFSSILSDYKTNGRMSLEFRPLLEFYIEYYKRKGDKGQQLAAVDQLLLFDRDIYASQNAIDKRLRKEYDEKRLLQERQNIENYYSKERWSLIAIVVLLVMGSGSWYLYKKRQKYISVKLESTSSHDEALLNEPILSNELVITTLDAPESKVDYSIYQPINKQTVKIILKNLEDFEQKRQYLQHDMKLGILAERFNTNEKYISRIIKVKTGKNFNNYINELRFNYLHFYIKSNPDYKDQKIKKISYDLGFGTPELFAKLFKEKYKVSPSEYFSK